MTYEELRQEVYHHYLGQEYNAGHNLLIQGIGDYPEFAGQMLYWQACFEGLLQQPEAALHTLQEMIDRELWVTAELVRTDSDLAVIAGRPQFERIIEGFARLEQEARSQSRPRMLVLQPAAATPSPYPLVIAIHGRNDNARSFSEIWRPLTERGWLVALPQSSQILASACFGWDDQALAEEELANHFERLNNDYSIDDSRVLLAGFSQGGGLSIWLTLSQRIPATGFLALAPYLRGLENLETPQSTPVVKPRGFLAMGGQDDGQAMFEDFEARLKAAGIEFQERRYPDLEHEIPPDFSDLLKTALEFLYA